MLEDMGLMTILALAAPLMLLQILFTASHWCRAGTRGRAAGEGGGVKGPSGADSCVHTQGYFRLNPDKVEITERHVQLQTAVPADGKSISVFPLTGTYCGQTRAR